MDNYFEIQNTISKIIIGEKRVVKNGIEYVFHHPTPRETYNSYLIYEERLCELKAKSIMTEKEIFDLAEKQKIYTKRDEASFTFLEKVNRDLNRKFKTVDPRFKKSFKKRIEENQKQLSLLNSKRTALKSHSAEYLAYQSRLNYLLAKCIRKRNNEYFWPDVDTMLNTIQTDVYNFLMEEYIKFINGMPIQKIRAAARSPLWQTSFRYSVESGQQLFSQPSSEWDINKILLCYWSMIYKNVYEKDNCPPQAIIDDDDLFDDWLDKEQKKSKDKKSNKKQSFLKPAGMSTILN